MIKLSTGETFEKIQIWFGETLLGEISGSNSHLEFTKINVEEVHPAEFYFQPLETGASHLEIMNCLRDLYVVCEERANRPSIYPTWAITLIDEVYVHRDGLGDFPDRRLEFV